MEQSEAPVTLQDVIAYHQEKVDSAQAIVDAPWRRHDLPTMRRAHTTLARHAGFLQALRALEPEAEPVPCPRTADAQELHDAAMAQFQALHPAILRRSEYVDDVEIEVPWFLLRSKVGGLITIETAGDLNDTYWLIGTLPPNVLCVRPAEERPPALDYYKARIDALRFDPSEEAVTAAFRALVEVEEAISAAAFATALRQIKTAMRFNEPTMQAVLRETREEIAQAA